MTKAISPENYRTKKAPFSEDLFIDGEAVFKARIANGEMCPRCFRHNITNREPTGTPTECYDCAQAAADDSAINMDEKVRCPECRHIFDPAANEMYAALDDGEHEITCPECGEDFEITTSVSRDYDSPAMKTKGDDEDLE